MTKLKGVAVGAGYFSQYHFDAWSRLGDVELSAICDLDGKRAETAARQFGVAKWYDDFAEMLDAEQPEFVDIITRPDSHLKLVRELADRGIAVICQKPLAPTFEEARELVQIAHAAGIPLMVHENFRFQPWHREIKRLLENRTIGDCLHTISIRTRMGDGWPPDAYLSRQPYFRTMPRFLIFETGVHFIDTYRYLAGEIDGVYAVLRKHNSDISGEDAATVLFEFSKGTMGIWDGSRYNEPNTEDPRYTFGEALIEGNGGSIRLYSDGRLTVQPLGEAEQVHVYEHSAQSFAGDCVFATQQHFVRCLNDAQHFETCGQDYLRTLAVQEAIYASAESQMPVRGLANTEVFHENH